MPISPLPKPTRPSTTKPDPRKIKLPKPKGATRPSGWTGDGRPRPNLVEILRKKGKKGGKAKPKPAPPGTGVHDPGKAKDGGKLVRRWHKRLKRGEVSVGSQIINEKGEVIGVRWENPDKAMVNRRK